MMANMSASPIKRGVRLVFIIIPISLRHKWQQMLASLYQKVEANGMERFLQHINGRLPVENQANSSQSTQMNL